MVYQESWLFVLRCTFCVDVHGTTTNLPCLSLSHGRMRHRLTPPRRYTLRPRLDRRSSLHVSPPRRREFHLSSIRSVHVQYWRLYSRGTRRHGCRGSAILPSRAHSIRYQMRLARNDASSFDHRPCSIHHAYAGPDEPP